MMRYYLKWEDGGRETGPYPTQKMAEFMSATYEVVLKRESKVVERDDEA